MSDPAILYGVGATKAGTSWLYRYLHDHPECSLPAVKEAHYWDTFNAGARDKQLAAYGQRLVELRNLKAEAAVAGRGWQVQNVTRRIADMEALIEVIGGDRQGDLAYGAWLTQGRGAARLVADITPNYATLPEGKLERMAALSPATRFISLLRDPIDRLWSHVRMQARRFRQDHEVYEKKANNILWRIVNAGAETHITERGDYPATIEKLERVVPKDRLMVAFSETLLTVPGAERLCAFLGIAPHAAEAPERVHEGRSVEMREDLRPKVAAFLKDQYDWVARHMGPLPQAWQDNLQKALA